MTLKTKTLWVCFILGVLSFTFGLYSLEIIRMNCRYGLFAYEMDLSHIGPFPILYGKPYADYPSLHVILISLVTRLLGVNMLSLSLPSIFAGAGILVVTYLIGEKQSHKFGLYAVLLLVLSYQFIAIVRTPSPDIVVALFGVLAFYLVYMADFEKKYIYLIYLPFLAFLGFAMRGPIGTVIPAAIVVAYYLAGRNYKMLFGIGTIFAVMLVIGGGFFAAWSFFAGGEKLAEEFFTNQLFGRFPGNKAFWFYFTDGVAVYSLSFPFAILVMGTYLFVLRKAYFKPEGPESSARLRQALTVWIFIIMVGLSIPGSKHLRYIVCVVPATALMAAFIFENPDKLRLFDKFKTVFITICRYLPFAVVCFLLIAVAVLQLIKIPFALPFILPGIFFLILGIALNFYIRKIPIKNHNLFILLMMAIGLNAFIITVIDPIEQYLESSKELVEETEKIRPAGVPVCFYGLGPDGEDLKYMINVDRKKIFMPSFVHYLHPEELLTLPHKNMPIIANGSKIKFIAPDVMSHLKKIKEAKIGHRDCTVFVSDIYDINSQVNQP